MREAVQSIEQLYLQLVGNVKVAADAGVQQEACD